MRLKLYCNRFGHFKDALVADYYEARRAPKAAPSAPKNSHRALPVVAAMPKLVEAVDMGELIRLEVKREMAGTSYIWIDKDGKAELLEQNEVLRRATRGLKPQTIYRVAQEMELRFQLVPRRRIEKARAAEAVEAERTAARRAARRAPAQAAPPTEIVSTPAPAKAAPRRARRRAAAKTASERS